MKERARAHSKYSASGAERWLNCSAAVALAEGLPDVDTEASLRGTLAHKVLERIMLLLLAGELVSFRMFKTWKGVDRAMYEDALNAANFILGIGKDLQAEVRVETRVYLKFIHPEMFGTFDGAVIDYFATLHVFDFKYCTHLVSPRKNMQMLFYALGMAHRFKWNFEKVRLWIIQPRARGYDGPTYWDISISELRKFEKVFADGVKRVGTKPQFKEGDWCFFCKAKKICPLKIETKRSKTIDLFKSVPLIEQKEVRPNGKKEKSSKEVKSKAEEKRLAKKGWQATSEDEDNDGSRW